MLAAAVLVTANGSAPGQVDACPGDCNGDGRIRVDELVVHVSIALGLLSLDACETVDVDDNGALTIDEVVRAVAIVLNGCPTPTPTATLTPSTDTPTATGTATESATVTPTAGDTATPSVTASATETPTATPTATETSSVPTPTPTVTPVEPTITGTLPPTQTPTVSPASTATHTPTSTSTPTATATATPTVTPTATRTAAPGVRRFSLDPTSSGIRTVSNLAPPTERFGFQGYLDLALGPPDAMGIAQVDIVGASDFLSLTVAAEEGEESMTFCIRPIVPVVRAGVVDCDGGDDLGISTFQDHVVGVVGENGFTAENCAAVDGRIETAQEPHPNTCISPIFVQPSGVPDSGPGALLMAPDPRFATLGVPAQVSVDVGPCSTHGESESTLFGFVSAQYRVEIADPNGIMGDSLIQVDNGENLSCANWDQENGPGRLVLALGAIHGAGGGLIDLVTVFELDD
jgi:hypothetical protein